MKKIFDYLLVLICIIIIGMFYIKIIKGQTEISNIENRTLNKIEKFTIQDFINHKFQDNIEKAIPDQIFLSENIKIKVLSIKGKILNIFDKITFKLKHSKNNYISISNDIYTLDDDEWLIYKPEKFKFNADTINYFNKIDAKKYLYFIESDVSKMFNGEKTENVYEKLIKTMDLEKYNKLNVDTYEKYKQYFYKTDHHWNYKGQYQGYKDIINLLGISEKEQVKVSKEVKYNLSFWGSKAKGASKYDISDEFIVYKYDVKKPEKIYINGEESKYGNATLYDEGEIENTYTINHYGQYYGDDYGEIIFDYNANQKENLLIISNSYSNAINEIISSHFNKTYIIDLRHYENFEPNNYIKENKINKVLILGNIAIFTKEGYFTKINLEEYK